MTYHHFCKSHKVQNREKTSKSSNTASCKPVTLSCVGGKWRQRKQRGKKGIDDLRWSDGKEIEFAKQSERQQLWKVRCTMLFKHRPSPTLGSANRVNKNTWERKIKSLCSQSILTEKLFLHFMTKREDACPCNGHHCHTRVFQMFARVLLRTFKEVIKLLLTVPSQKSPSTRYSGL